jgi:predicted porin
MNRAQVGLLLAACFAVAKSASAEGINADVEVYGTLVPHLEYMETTGATSLADRAPASQVADAAFTGVEEPGRLRLTQGTSHIGFRGTVDVAGDALKVVWQIESGVPLDGDPVLNTFASRNSRVGFTGNWGTLFVGIWDNPYKWATLPVVNPIAAGFVPDYTAIISTPGFTVGALNLSPGYVANAVPGPSPVPRSNAAFYRRDSNMIQYWSPTFYGLSLRASYTTNEFSRAARSATDTAPALPEISPDIVSTLLSYDWDALKVRYGFELHRDYFGTSLIGGAPGGSATNRSSQDMAHQGVVSYTFQYSEGLSTRIVGTAEYLSYESNDTTDGNVDSYKRAAFYGLIDQGIGGHHLWLAYGQADRGTCTRVGGGFCTTNGLGATLTTLGYLYRFSKNTDVYAAAYQVTNRNAATYLPFPPIDPLPTPGANVRSIGLGMLHHFSATAATKP